MENKKVVVGNAILKADETGYTIRAFNGQLTKIGDKNCAHAVYNSVSFLVNNKTNAGMEKLISEFGKPVSVSYLDTKEAVDELVKDAEFIKLSDYRLTLK